jgi:hypothetical protein
MEQINLIDKKLLLSGLKIPEAALCVKDVFGNGGE